MMRQLVAFDLDDTLVPEVLFLKSGIRHVAQSLSAKFPILDKHRIINIMDAAVMSRQNHYSALESLLGQTNLSDRIDMAKVVEDFRFHCPDPEIYHMSPHLTGILRNLKKRGIPMAIITDGRSITQRNKIQAAGIDQFIDNSNILISEETGRDKNHPDNFLFLMRKFAGYENFHYVGDNPSKDFLHPPRLGWHTHLVHPFPLMIHQ
ncbi:MAG: HAD hydrolase-like protein [Muribaculum sp.]|nr:HAD hydrolase-like protein [Muribaculum sp.]